MRFKLILIAILALFCMAPDYYFPIIAKPCPNPTILDMVTYQYYLGYRPYSYSATIVYEKYTHLVSISAFDVMTGEPLDDEGTVDWYVNGDESRVEKFFDIRDCHLTGTLYKVRFIMTFESGCQASINGEFIPLEIHGGPECKP